MGYRHRIYFTQAQKAEIWNCWQRGESMKSIGRLFDGGSSSITSLVVRGANGVAPACASAGSSSPSHAIAR